MSDQLNDIVIKDDRFTKPHYRVISDASLFGIKCRRSYGDLDGLPCLTEEFIVKWLGNDLVEFCERYGNR